MNDRIIIQDEVGQALKEGKPVVALESTIISHGMPYPKNVETALAVEQIVRDNGATPATIAIVNGKCRVGLSKDEIESFGNAKDIWKASLRDLPYIISQGLMGATTVAATMRIASLAGIAVFATGGIGGVHRGAEKSMDVSADLTEMSQTTVAIVSAGVKSILDIGLTLEYLETLGVPVVTFGQNEFPSFYSRKSGFNSPLRLDDYNSVASLMKAKWSMGLKGSVLIANPVAAEKEIPFDIIEKHIIQALDAAEKNKITGKEITPFILQHIANNSNGESLETNIALIKSNAAVAANIAKAYINA